MLGGRIPPENRVWAGVMEQDRQKTATKISEMNEDLIPPYTPSSTEAH